MDKLSKQQAEDILLVYEQIQCGEVNGPNITEVMSYLPGDNNSENVVVSMRAINLYVMTHEQELLTMATTIVNEQTEHGEVVPDYKLEAGVKPKRKPRRKTKARRKK